MSVYSFCPEQIKHTLSQVNIKNKGTVEDLLTYKELWIKWIKHFGGCENKKQWAICNGIHDAITNQIAYKSSSVNKFYHFENDYGFYYHMLAPYNSQSITWDQINSIENNSYVVVSQPNHVGAIHNLDELIDQCIKTDSKIFLDCAFYGSSFETLDTDRDVFDCVAFSLSKNFMLGGLRAGIVFGNDVAKTLTVPIDNKNFSYTYYNSCAVQSANLILSQYDCHYILRHAKPIQHNYCNEHNLIPCNVWMLAYQNGQRVCITDFIKDQIQHELYVSQPK